MSIVVALPTFLVPELGVGMTAYCPIGVSQKGVVMGKLSTWERRRAWMELYTQIQCLTACLIQRWTHAGTLLTMAMHA